MLNYSTFIKNNKTYEMEISEAKKAVCEASKRLLKEGLVKGTWGNISVRIDDRYMVITPGGVPYEKLNEWLL